MTITWEIDVLSRAGTPGAYDDYTYGGRPYEVGSLMWDDHCLMYREAPLGELPATLADLDRSLPPPEDYWRPCDLSTTPADFTGARHHADLPAEVFVSDIADAHGGGWRPPTLLAAWARRWAIRLAAEDRPYHCGYGPKLAGALQAACWAADQSHWPAVPPALRSVLERLDEVRSICDRLYTASFGGLGDVLAVIRDLERLA